MFYVNDVIGCDTTSNSVKIKEPPPIELTDSTIIDAKCAATPIPGSIEVTMAGGTKGIMKEYRYIWTKEFENPVEDDNYFYPADYGLYALAVLDSNQCQFLDTFFVNTVDPIIVQTDAAPYNGYEVSCYGSSDGILGIEVREGFAPYDVKVYPYLGLGYDEPDYASTTPVATIEGVGSNERR